MALGRPGNGQLHHTGRGEAWSHMTKGKLARALLGCLNYLQREAEGAGFRDLAHLIGTAALEAEDTVHDLDLMRRRAQRRKSNGSRSH